MNKNLLFSIIVTSVLTATFTTHTQAAQVTNNKTAIESLKTLRKTAHARTLFNKYNVILTETDGLGFTHSTLSPTVKGKVVSERAIKVHVNP